MAHLLKDNFIDFYVKEFTDKLLNVIQKDDTTHVYYVIAKSWRFRNTVARDMITSAAKYTISEMWDPHIIQGNVTQESIYRLKRIIPTVFKDKIEYHRDHISPDPSPSPPTRITTGHGSVESLSLPNQRAESPVYVTPGIMLGDMDMGNSSGSESGGNGSRQFTER